MSDIRRISVQEAQALLGDGYVYLDVRTEAEYAAGHPVGAHNVPWAHAGPAGMTPNPEFLRIVEALYDKDCKLVVGCKAGGRSLCAVQAMVAAGYTAVVDVRAGYAGAVNPFGQVTEPGWEPSGLPTEAVTGGASYQELRQRVSDEALQDERVSDEALEDERVG